MTPFLLKGAKVIPSKALPTEGCYYDPQKQIWTDSRTGNPRVLSNIDNTTSDIGETLFSRTGESADQSESSFISASDIGETLLTQTFEAADQSELVTYVPNFRSNTSSIEYEGNPNEMENQFKLQFLIDAPYTHF